jgi:hypothetical protein
VPTRSQLLTLSSARKLHSASLQSIYWKSILIILSCDRSDYGKGFG